MKKKIKWNLLFIGILSMILTGVLIISVFHQTFKAQAKSDLKMNATIIAQGYDTFDDYSELEIFNNQELRITLVSQTGDVLYDSAANKSEMENHKNREEIIKALAYGEGETIRDSGTLGVHTYYYAVKVNDGNVLRISKDVIGIYENYNKTIPLLLIIGLGVLFLSAFLGTVLTKKLVEPIEAMAQNVDNIDKEIPYKELEPFALAVKEHQTKKTEIGKMRQEFTANVTHELKTPLTSISGYAEMIVSGMAKDEDIKRFAGKIHVESGRLIDLIGDILNLSELDEPEIRTQTELINLYQVALNIKEMLALKADEHKVTVTVGGENAFIVGNKMMFEEMMYNLCDNAIRYNKEGGNVKLNTFNYVDKVSVVVEDNGIGIPKEHHDRIFERFYRVDKSRSKATGGTGLGLAIVKHIVMQNNGKLYIDSTPGEGTLMRVVFRKKEKDLI